MNHLESWLDFRRNEVCEPSTPLCHWCGTPCTGDVTETVEIVDGMTAERPICDEPDECPANQEG